MLRTAKILFAALMLTSITLSAVADRGMGKKSKLKVFSAALSNNIALRSAIAFNLKSGFTYKSSQLGRASFSNNSFSSNALITYQKGNNVYVLPAKQKITALPEMQQGYTGMKLIIRH